MQVTVPVHGNMEHRQIVRVEQNQQQQQQPPPPAHRDPRGVRGEIWKKIKDFSNETGVFYKSDGGARIFLHFLV